MDLRYKPPKPRSIPRNKWDWLDMWREEMEMVVPGRDGKSMRLQLIQFDVLHHSSYDPYAIDVRVSDSFYGLKFGVVLTEHRAFEPYSELVLVHPPERGVRAAFWLKPRT